MKRVVINHGIIFFLFVAGGAVVVIGIGVAFKLILPLAMGQAVFLAELLGLIIWILSWILRGLYISNRDLSIEDMGRVALGKYNAVCEEIYQNKYGDGKPKQGTR